MSPTKKSVKKKPKTWVTDAMLRRMGACPSQRTIFRKAFPNGCSMTKTAIEKALKHKLDVLWFVKVGPDALFSALENANLDEHWPWTDDVAPKRYHSKIATVMAKAWKDIHKNRS